MAARKSSASVSSSVSAAAPPASAEGAGGPSVADSARPKRTVPTGRGRAEAGLQSDAMQKALLTAVAGDERPLFAVLRRFSGLPGVRANVKLAEAFGESVASLGAKTGVPLATGMLRLHADVAEGGTDLEFLPICAVFALGALGARTIREELAGKVEISKKKGAVPMSRTIHELLHEAADDLRYRVRDAVPENLARLGEFAKDSLLHELVEWTDGYFHGRAALLALTNARFLHAVSDSDAVAARLSECFTLLAKAQRSTARFPGFKALLEASQTVPGIFALAHGNVIVDTLIPFAKTEEPYMRDTLQKFANDLRSSGRMGEEANRVEAALAASKKAPRDPSRIVEGMRGRSKKR